MRQLRVLCVRDPGRTPQDPPLSFPTARMTVYSGLTNKSALLYDSLQTESVPFEGLLSEDHSIRIEFTSDQAPPASAFNIRFEGEGRPLPGWGRGSRGRRAGAGSWEVESRPAEDEGRPGGQPEPLTSNVLGGQMFVFTF